MATIQELAEQLSRALVQDKRNDGSEFVKLKDDSPQWMTDVIHAAHGDKFPDDTVYDFVSRAASALAESSEEYPEDAIGEIEPDIYTSDLTGWLHERADHIYYLQEALEDGWDLSSGTPQVSDLLMRAQGKQIEEVGYALLEALRGIAGDGDSDGDDPDEGPEDDEKDDFTLEALRSHYDGKRNQFSDNDYWCFPTDPNDYDAEARRLQIRPLRVEINAAFIQDDATWVTRQGSILMVTPPLDENYWWLRVALSDQQAVVAFPKFGTVGIGFQREAVSWNTNLPYTCTATEIYTHIAKNKEDGAISAADCVAAIELLQTTIRALETDANSPR